MWGRRVASVGTGIGYENKVLDGRCNTWVDSSSAKSRGHYIDS